LSYPGNRAATTAATPRGGTGVPEEISRSSWARRSQVHAGANRGTMAPVKLPVATTAAAFAAGFAIGTRSRRARLRVVTTDGSTVRPARTRAGVARVPSKARAVVVLGAVRARDAVGVRLGWRDGEAATEALVIEMTGDLATAINGRSTLAG